MKNKFLYCALGFSMFFLFQPLPGFSEEGSDATVAEKGNSEAVSSQEKLYDSINWIDLKRREGEEEDGWYERFRAIFFRERSKKSLSGDDITILETLEVGNDKEADTTSPVSIIKIEK